MPPSDRLGARKYTFRSLFVNYNLIWINPHQLNKNFDDTANFIAYKDIQHRFSRETDSIEDKIYMGPETVERNNTAISMLFSEYWKRMQYVLNEKNLKLLIC